MKDYQNRRFEVGRRIMEERKKLGLSRKQLLPLIYKSEASHKTLTSWENGERLPDLDSLSAMADLFKCDIGYLLGDYPERTRAISDICSLTGLSAAAASSITVDESDGFRNTRIEALNFILTSVNFENALHELARFKGIEAEAASLEKAQSESILKLNDIAEYRPNTALLELVSEKRQEATLCEYNLSKNLTFVVEELKRKIDKEVLENG